MEITARKLCGDFLLLWPLARPVPRAREDDPGSVVVHVPVMDILILGRTSNQLSFYAGVPYDSLMNMKKGE